MLTKKITKLILLSLIAVAIVLPITSFAGDTTYIYDDLGRLNQVIDAQGDITTTYTYDSVGNLLSITKATGPQPPLITSITPSSALQGDTLSITITGDNLSGADLNTDNSITISNVSTSKTSITATFSISYQASDGVTVVTVETSSGLASINFTVNARPPLITTLSPESGPVSRLVTITGTGFSLTPLENIVSFNGTQSQVITAGGNHNSYKRSCRSNIRPCNSDREWPYIKRDLFYNYAL